MTNIEKVNKALANANEDKIKEVLDLKIRKAKLIKEIEDSSEPMDFSDKKQNKYHFWLDRYNNVLRVNTDVYAQAQGATYTTNEPFLEELKETRSDEVKELLFNIKVTEQ